MPQPRLRPRSDDSQAGVTVLRSPPRVATLEIRPAALTPRRPPEEAQTPTPGLRFSGETQAGKAARQLGPAPSAAPTGGRGICTLCSSGSEGQRGSGRSRGASQQQQQERCRSLPVTAL